MIIRLFTVDAAGNKEFLDDLRVEAAPQVGQKVLYEEQRPSAGSAPMASPVTEYDVVRVDYTVKNGAAALEVYLMEA